MIAAVSISCWLVDDGGIFASVMDVPFSNFYLIMNRYLYLVFKCA